MEEGLDGQAGADQRRLGGPLERRLAGSDSEQGADLPLRLGQHQGRVPRHSQRKEFEIYFSQGEFVFTL